MHIRRANAVYLADVTFPDGVEPTASLAAAIEDADLVVVAIPTHGVAAVMRPASALIRPGTTVVSATKGIDVETLMRVSELLDRELQRACPIVVLSGPSFAVELARQLPTAICVASHDAAAVERVQAEFRSRYLRLYATDDVVGVEVGGALKNVIAIAAGVVEGLGLGHNALAALITRGLAEIGRLATALGARRETLAGLAGLGDLVLTCTGSLSRNRHVGMELAQGRPLPEIVGGMRMVAEGVRTTDAALALGARVGIELPITIQMAEVLSGRRSARDAVGELMLRPQRAEPEPG
jgi:glycerol-3-phosphate dehydrogenase (NAD(P)+)